MEKDQPKKSGSFACRDPDSCPASESVNVEAQPDEHETKEKHKEEEESEQKDDSSPDTDSITLPKVSEDIDRFISDLCDSISTPNPPEVPNSIEQFAELVETEITKYESNESTTKWSHELDEDTSSLLEAVNRISKLANAFGGFPSETKYTYSLSRASRILQRAMSFLEEEFRSLLEDSRSVDSDPTITKQPSFNSNNDSDRNAQGEPDSARDTNFPGYSPDTVDNLNRIASAMISAGYETECCQVYTIARRNAFEERLSKHGFEKISIDDVQKMQWETLEAEIATWIKAFKRCISIYFSAERQLCESVFSCNPTLYDGLFCNLTRGVLIQLLNFAEAVAMTKRSAEKLFKFLDMYETLRDLIPAMTGLFSEEPLRELKTETTSARCRLGEAAVTIFCELENSIKTDAGKTPVPGGAVHPLTRYTMNYLKYACEYKDTLEQVFQEHQKIEQSDASAGSDAESEPSSGADQVAKQSPFSKQLLRVMDLLSSNLEIKSKLYKDPSLSYIFLMNNGRYIVQKIKGSAEIYELIGNSWCRKKSSELRQYHKNYQRETWNKVLALLRDEGLQVHGKVAKQALKERFKSFNSMFEEIHKTQSSWVVSDEQLQSELRVSISAVVIPAYRSFVGRFRQYLDSGRQAEKYIKYGPEDIETYIDELFEGNPASMVKRKN
ncbi:PREDICTED: exocyst complex component EXO70B1-like [Nelumbo nucifera]|uniref:Exocyst subunit Exo70 family protein n=1 Tax=Nelumbo nucifera TaxID=4432 RepID=A0A1U7ZQZ8_NELNU|nr:PREDICTED: exocyst complex component EXO70B1-like [Nelumbo nucifera]